MARIMWMDLYRDLKERTKPVLESEHDVKALEEDRIDDVIAALEAIAGVQFAPETFLCSLKGELDHHATQGFIRKCQKAIDTRELFGEWENLRGLRKTLMARA